MCRVLFAVLFFLMSQAVHAQAPFGLLEVPVGGDIQRKWDAVRQASVHDQESPKLLEFAKQFADLHGRTLVGHINRAVNLLIYARSDLAQWGEEDHWSPALETLETMAGDCEDYAVLKYTLLESHFLVRVVVGYNPIRHEDHAILMVLIDGEWFALNNSTNTLVWDGDMMWFQPKYSLSNKGAFALVSPKLAMK